MQQSSNISNLNLAMHHWQQLSILEKDVFKSYQTANQITVEKNKIVSNSFSATIFRAQVRKKLRDIPKHNARVTRLLQSS